MGGGNLISKSVQIQGYIFSTLFNIPPPQKKNLIKPQKMCIFFLKMGWGGGAIIDQPPGPPCSYISKI